MYDIVCLQERPDTYGSDSRPSEKPECVTTAAEIQAHSKLHSHLTSSQLEMQKTMAADIKKKGDKTSHPSSASSKSKGNIWQTEQVVPTETVEEVYTTEQTEELLTTAKKIVEGVVATAVNSSRSSRYRQRK